MASRKRIANMQSLMSKVAAERAAAAEFDALPVEVCQKLLEFIPSHDVAVAKPSSTVLASAARFALTRGRWKPLKKFCETGREALHDKNAETQALFREVWALEPSEVLVELAFPDRSKFFPHSKSDQDNILAFLLVVEPSTDGLGRVFAAFRATRTPIPQDVVRLWHHQVYTRSARFGDPASAIAFIRARRADHSRRYQEAYRAARREGLPQAETMRRAAAVVEQGMSPGQLPASPGQNIGRQPSWADLPEGTPSIADAWDAFTTEH